MQTSKYKGFKKQLLIDGWLLPENEKYYTDSDSRKSIHRDDLLLFLNQLVAIVVHRSSMELEGVVTQKNSCLFAIDFLSEVEPQMVSITKEENRQKLFKLLDRLRKNDAAYIKYIYDLMDSIKADVKAGNYHQAYSFITETYQFKQWAREANENETRN